MTTKEMIAVMQAYLDGKSIQYRTKGNSEWERCSFPLWDWASCEYRIKPEQKYRPYKDTEEMIADFKERFFVDNPKNTMPFIWVRNGDKTGVIGGFTNDVVWVDSVNTPYCTMSLDGLYETCTYLDGSPIGKLVD